MRGLLVKHKEEDHKSNNLSSPIELVAGGLSVILNFSLSAYTLLYIAPELPPKHKQMSDILLKTLSGPNPTASCFSYSPPTKTMTEMTFLPKPLSKFLSRRYFLVQKSKLVRIYSAPVWSFAISWFYFLPLLKLIVLFSHHFRLQLA